MDPSSHEASNSQNAYTFPSFMSMLGNPEYSQTSSNANMPYNHQIPPMFYPPYNATPPRFFTPPQYPIHPNSYPPNFQMDTPQFCTQVPEEEHDVEDITPSKESKKTWTSRDDEVLISAWINTSKNALTATDQRAETFWDRISTYFNLNKQEEQVRRTSKQCKSHWQKLSAAVSKFVGCHEQALQRKMSGQSSTDVYNMAKLIYHSDNGGKDFKLEHAWRILKEEQKWKEAYCAAPNKSDGSSKRSRINEDGGYSSNSNPPTPQSGSVGENESPDIRPPGVKACKNKGKQVRKSTSISHSIDYYDEITNAKNEALAQLKSINDDRMKQKEENWSNKMKFQKMRILEKLLEKGDNLTEAEQILKDKYIKDLI